MGYAEDNKNYYIKDNKAYTEDNICVYNLFVFKIPHKVKEEEVQKYFSQFGEIEKVRLVADKKRNRRQAPKVGFIHFTDALVAAKVLQKSYHALQSKRVSVKACDSWHQPEATNVENDASEKLSGGDPTGSNSDTADELGGSGITTMDINASPPQMNILELNDDCLEHIFKKLELRDQVRFTRVCQRFRDIFRMCSKVLHKHVMLNKFDAMTLLEIREFFIVTGPTIESLIGKLPAKDRERVVELISNNCPNVKCIDMDSSKIKSNCFRKMIEKMKSINELQLRDCSLNDNALLALKKLPNLETLGVSDNYELTGKNINKLTNLRELDLQGCGNIQSTFFIEIVKSLPELHTLNIRRCDRLSTNVFTSMVEHCLKLKSLKMSCMEAPYFKIALLPALTRLELIADSPIRNQIFVELADHKSTQLEYLKITGRNCINLERAVYISRLSKLKHLICANSEDLNDDCLGKLCELEDLEEIVIKHCQSITNDGLLKLVRKCTKLKSVNVQRCGNINDKFVFDVIDLLRHRQTQRQKEQSSQKTKQQVIFYVYRTGISEFIMKDSKCHNTSSFLKISHYCPFNINNTEEEDRMEIMDYLDDDDYDYEFDDIDDHDDDDDADYIVDLDDDDDDPYHIHDYSDMDDDDFHHAYNMFGRFGPFGDDIDDYIW